MKSQSVFAMTEASKNLEKKFLRCLKIYSIVIKFINSGFLNFYDSFGRRNDWLGKGSRY